MNPNLNVYGPCLIVLAEWKAPVYGTAGIKLVTSSVRRNSPQCLDSKIHHANLINNILAKIEANAAGADDAIMLDVEGFVAETNATNLFLVKGGILKTPFADHCLPGITRRVVLEIARANDIPCEEARLTLAQFHSADEVFTTGTMGELAPVLEIDGRTIGGRAIEERSIGAGTSAGLTQRLRALFAERTSSQGEVLPG
jgi:branched-subunit amino acid aminotransferase/4-amino-4-deoxychorismate lyase